MLDARKIDVALKDMYDSLSEDTKQRLHEATTPEEMLAVASEEGVELTDEQLEAVSGGLWSCSDYCQDVNGGEYQT